MSELEREVLAYLDAVELFRLEGFPPAWQGDRLRRRLGPSELPFETTAELVPQEGTSGQPRGLDAIEFGLEVATNGSEQRSASWRRTSPRSRPARSSELLTGTPAGERQADGLMRPDAVHRLTEDCLRGYADQLKAFSAVGESSADGRAAAATPRSA